MAFETKEQVLEKILSAEKPKCPHCGQSMDIWEVPPITFSDGLGWGTPYLFGCFNDECPLFKKGWDSIRENYAHNASYRCICYPDSKKYEYMPVFSLMGAKGQIITDQLMAEQEALKEAIKKGFSLLATCYSEQDWTSVLRVLMDATEPVRVRLKAAEMMGDFGEVEAIEPMRIARFGNEKLQKAVDDAISGIHKRHFTRECPFCAEIIKKRAKICKHCKMDVSGK